MEQTATRQQDEAPPQPETPAQRAPAAPLPTETALLFGETVELPDGPARLAGIQVEPESWRLDALVLERGALLRRASRRAPASALLPGRGLWVAEPWGQLDRFDAHRRHPSLLRPATRVHFLDRSALRRISAPLLGVLMGDERRLAHLVITLAGRRLLLPSEAASFQNEEWVYVDGDRWPPEHLPVFRP